MTHFWQACSWLCLVPVLGGTVWGVLSAWAALALRKQWRATPTATPDRLPPISVLKPVRGVEKHLERNLRSLCEQDYPCYQVVFCVQQAADPALPLLRRIERDYGPERVTLVVDDLLLGSNGKVNNMAGGLVGARHSVLVISDSDVLAPRHYLRDMAAALAPEDVGVVCSLFRVDDADTTLEKLEALSINADFMPGVMFAAKTDIADFCLGPSTALRRETLEKIGGFEALADYLVEDYEIGRRVRAAGKRVVLAPHVLQVTADLSDVSGWWKHQVYWDLNTRLANPAGYAATLLIRAVPFALLFALLRGLDPVGVAVLAGATAVRLLGAALAMQRGLDDRGGLAALWLLPLRDVLGLPVWFGALLSRTVVWRDRAYLLTTGGRMVLYDPRAQGDSSPTPAPAPTQVAP